MAAEPVKCVVWDLDETLWSGVMLEGGANALNGGIEEIVRTLDQRGILQSIASKNDEQEAKGRLAALGIAEFFLHPQINWGSKAKSIETIAKLLNIGLDTFAFVDDQAAERDEVSFFHPQVLALKPHELAGLLDQPRFNPRFVTAESHQRRAMYVADIEREKAERDFAGKRDQFLANLHMRMTIRAARVEDLERAEELTVRTNQLNTTSQTYTYEELSALVASPEHLVLVAELDDRYGSSGVIGLTVVELGRPYWTIRLLIMSCRVVARGVGSVFLTHILRRAKSARAKVRALYIPTPRNRPILITLRFAGFEFTDDHVLQHDLSKIPRLPKYVEVVSDAAR